MRTCAKMRCDGEPVSTITLAYSERVVLVGDLIADRDPNLLDLCWEHAQRMTPPVGWTIRDQRTAAAAVR
jgi:Protein of unknown function (DUF3499)